ncbi:hypothetical protein WN51_01117 [Melipona quadrifasciata]|uniref:Uncharacterized protein n=1 Tax=Melipona quadrifasciata TaxID=166423 RepID=A0A0N0BFF3_9HYME|nr:hypothetical protein WN51_01117 [Melipona quadrifasciata]
MGGALAIVIACRGCRVYKAREVVGEGAKVASSVKVLVGDNDTAICQQKVKILGYAGLMRPLIVSETIAWFRDVYVEHVTGTRQYLVPAPGEQPEAPVARDGQRPSEHNDDGVCTSNADL